MCDIYVIQKIAIWNKVIEKNIKKKIMLEVKKMYLTKEEERKRFVYDLRLCFSEDKNTITGTKILIHVDSWSRTIW